jgi:ABC-2 type transport system ATP-binding protein
VAVIDHGKIIALGSPAELIAGLGGEHIIEFALANGGIAADRELSALPAVKEARSDGNGQALTVSELHIAIPALLKYLQSQNLNLARLSTRNASLEDVFVNLTGRHLRDDELSSF